MGVQEYLEQLINEGKLTPEEAVGYMDLTVSEIKEICDDEV